MISAATISTLAVPEGHLCVRWAARDFAGAECDDERCHVGEVVNGIRDQREAAGEDSPDDLGDRQEAVGPDGDRDPSVPFLGLNMGMIMRHAVSFPFWAGSSHHLFEGEEQQETDEEHRRDPRPVGCFMRFHQQFLGHEVEQRDQPEAQKPGDVVRREAWRPALR